MITEKEFRSLFDENITKKEYNRITNEIDKRFIEICDKFLIKRHKSKSWFDYDTGGFEEGNGGFFEPEAYEDDIYIVGEYIESPPGYDLQFPTRWLWEENFEEEMKSISKEFLNKQEKQKKKQVKDNKLKKEKIDKLKSNIQNKLSKEELAIIKFK